jgi:hypothetical protein
MTASLMVKELQQWRKQEGLPWNQNWVPKEFDSFQDLEMKYAEAEDAARNLKRVTKRACQRHCHHHDHGGNHPT